MKIMVLKSDYIIYKQCCGSGSKFDGSGSCCHKKTDPDPADIKKRIRIRILRTKKTDPDPGEILHVHNGK